MPAAPHAPGIRSPHRPPASVLAFLQPDCLTRPLRLSALDHHSAPLTAFRQSDAIRLPSIEEPAGTKPIPFLLRYYSIFDLAQCEGHAGIVERTLDNSAAYISNWLERLRGDSKLVVQAAASARKAADFILGQYDQPEVSAE